jgi:two-component system sporulation sensor kinase B
MKIITYNLINTLFIYTITTGDPIMMIVVLLALWSISAILLFTDPRRESTHWASILAFVGSFGFLAAVIDENIRPFLQIQYSMTPEIDEKVHYASIMSSFLCQTGLPYIFLQYALSLSPFISPKAKKRIRLISILPVLFMIWVTPMVPELAFNYSLFIIWVAPYTIGASALLLYSYWIEKDPVMKRTKLLSNILTIIPLMCILFSIYIARIFGFYDAWRYNQFIIILQFVGFIAFCIRYGVLGVKLRFESYRLDSTIRALTSGSTILNHTIKNEIGKINMFAMRVQDYASEDKRKEMDEDIQILMQSTDHLLNMVNRIQDQTKEIVLKVDPSSIHYMIEGTLRKLRPYLEKHQIKIVQQQTEDVHLLCDPVHVQEVFTNIIMNATEAMRNGGQLKIHQYEWKKNMVIAFEDTGPGISKENFPFVLDPFFSTKKQRNNFGLGLSYCYNVMKRHGGSLEIHSEEGQGTTLFLYFPKKKTMTKK